jgi:hypothetical protein
MLDACFPLFSDAPIIYKIYVGEACPFRTIWLFNCIIHNEEGRRTVSQSATNVSHTTLYSITEHVLSLSSSAEAGSEVGSTSVTTNALWSSSRAQRSGSPTPSSVLICRLSKGEKERQMGPLPSERWDHCPRYFSEVIIFPHEIPQLRFIPFFYNSRGHLLQPGVFGSCMLRSLTVT